jgi:hypothetical protein
MIRTVTLPLYLFDDQEIEALIEKSMEIMTELAGERETAELPPLIASLRKELEARGRTVSLNDDGTFSSSGRGDGNFPPS